MGAPLTVRQLLGVVDGLDSEAPVIVGIINGPTFNAAYADQQVRGGILSLYICCYENPRPWEGPQPIDRGHGSASLEYDPENEDRD